MLCSDKFTFPVKVGEFKMLTELPNELNYGIYRCNIEPSLDENVNKLFKFNSKNYYTHYDIQLARKLNLSVYLMLDETNALLYTKDREYKSGQMNEFGSPSATQTNLTIFGKSTFETKIDTLFSGLLDDINNGRLTIQSEMTQRNFKPVDQTNFNNQLKKLVNDYKVKFTDKLVTTSNELSKVQLSMTRNIDKLNYVVQGLDGYIDTKGIPQIYTIDSATTVNEIGIVMNTYSTEINKLNTNLETKKIITSTYDDNQSYLLPGGSFVTNTADKKFFLVFGWQLANNYREFETQVTGSFTSKDWTNFISESLTKNYKVPADNEKKVMGTIFSDYKKSTNKVYVPGDVTTLIKNKRQTSLTIKTSATPEDKTRLQNLYTGQNVGNKNTFNGKVIF
jgi:hypothetical protein